MEQTDRMNPIELAIMAVLSLVLLIIIGPHIGKALNEVIPQTSSTASSEIVVGWESWDPAIELDVPEIDLDTENASEITTFLSAEGQILAINMPGIDWDRAANHPHSVARHDPRGVRCIADIMKWFGGTQLWSSGYYAKLPTKSPKFPAYALIRNLGEGYDALFSAGKLGGCSEMTLEVLEKEFPADLIKKLNGNKLFHQFYAVVVAGRKVDGQGNESAEFNTNFPTQPLLT